MQRVNHCTLYEDSLSQLASYVIPALVCARAWKSEIRRSQSIGGGLISKIFMWTASSDIDPMPLPTCPHRDDMPDEAFNSNFFSPKQES